MRHRAYPPASKEPYCRPNAGQAGASNALGYALHIGKLGMRSPMSGAPKAPPSLTSPSVTGNCRGHKNEAGCGSGRSRRPECTNRSNHSRTRQRAAADRRRAQRPAGSSRGFGALAFRHVPDRRHLERADGRGAVCRPRRPRATGHAARDRRILSTCNKEGEAGEEAKTARLSPPRQIAKAKDRRRMEVSMVDQGRRPRRHPHHALRADQDGAGGRPQDDPQLSALRPACGVCRGRRGSDRTRPARSMAPRSRAR